MCEEGREGGRGKGGDEREGRRGGKGVEREGWRRQNIVMENKMCSSACLMMLDSCLFIQGVETKVHPSASVSEN